MMTILRILGNILWFVFTGFWGALGFVLGGALWCITIVGIPFGLQLFKLASFYLWPFGKKSNEDFDRHPIANMLWLMFGGEIYVVFYLAEGIALCCTIIGIPFGLQCFKFARLTIAPFGSKVVAK